MTTDSGEEKGREITGVYPQSLQDPKMGGSRLAKMADEEEELGTSGHEVEHPPMAGGAGEKGDEEESRVRRSWRDVDEAGRRCAAVWRGCRLMALGE